jgi:hypothetical protein
MKIRRLGELGERENERMRVIEKVHDEGCLMGIYVVGRS